MAEFSDEERLVWRCLLGQPVDWRPGAFFSRPAGELVGRIAARLSRSFIEALLAPLNCKLPGATNALLLSRLNYTAQKRAFERLEAAGLAPIALKGFANAHRLYPDPVPRIVGDLDVLLERRHLRTAIELLAPDGFRFAPITAKPLEMRSPVKR